MRHHRPLSIALAPCALALLLAACEAPSTPTAPPTAQAARTAAPVSYRVPSVHVTLRQLQAGRKLFASHVRAVGGEALTATENEVPWSALVEHMPAASEGWQRALVVHYGLDAPACRLAWGWRLVAAAPDSSGLLPLRPTDHRAYERVGDSTVAHDEDAWLWAHQLRPDRPTYAAAVELDRQLPSDTAARWEPVRPSDPRRCLLPYDRELALLYADNADEFAGKEEHLYAVLACTAELRADELHDEPYVAHTITVFLRLKVPGLPVRDLITDAGGGEPGRAFHLRGADYGHLCPARCAAVEPR
jgi:hypothetical protein